LWGIGKEKQTTKGKIRHILDGFCEKGMGMGREYPYESTEKTGVKRDVRKGQPYRVITTIHAVLLRSRK